MTIASGSNLLGVSFPDDWLRSKIGRITTKIGSGATPKGGANVYQATGIPLIRSLNVHNEGFRSYNLAFINDDHARQLEYASVETGDVLLNITGASILRSAVVPAEVGPARVNQHVSILRPDTNQVLPGYLHAWLISPAMYSYMYSQSVGSTREAITKEQILRFPMVLPTLEEQRAIVGFLDAKTAEIDGLVEKLQREVELLERYRRELIAYTVTRGLDPDVPMKDSGIDWIRNIPAHWSKNSLKSIIRRVSVKNKPQRRVLSVERANGVVDRETEGSPDNHNRLPDDLSSYLAVDRGQFVMNKMKAWRGSYGVSKQDGIVSPAYYVFELNHPNPDFFNWAIRSDAYIPFFGRDSYGIRTDQWDFKIPALRTIPFFTPSINEQVEIVAYLEHETSILDSAISNINKQIELLGKYRKQVINDAMTGKVRVGGVA